MLKDKKVQYKNARQQNGVVEMKWVIQIGGDYGSFLFEGTEEEAEDRRKAKARWEGAVGLKRPADEDETKSGKTSYCWNHPNFSHRKKGLRYLCYCEKCRLTDSN